MWNFWNCALYYLNMAPSGQVQRKCSGYFTQVMYADRTEAPWKGVLWDRVADTPLSPLLLSELHVIGCFWFLIYLILWEVTIFGTLEMFTPRGRGSTTKYLEYFILNPHVAWHPHLSHGKGDAGLIHKNHDAAVICWLHSRECDKCFLQAAVGWFWLSCLS